MTNPFFTWPGQIALAFTLDILLGDPECFFHPVRIIGKAIQIAEVFLRGKFSNLRLAGIVLALSAVGVSGCCAWLFLMAADAVSPWVGSLVRIYLLYTCLSARCLAVEVKSVLKFLRLGKIQEARLRLSRIVGRDTERLEEKEILRAALETTAESTVDGVVSVLFYAFLGGPVLAVMFKTVSTLDSMVGYRNERYRQFGWASARLDDMANYIPARVGAMCVSAACLLVGLSPQKALETVWRDARSQPSPNSGYPEAAFAGALGVQLGGENFYQSQSVTKAFLGEAEEKLTIQKVEQSLRLMFATSVLALAVGISLWALAAK